MHVAIPDTCFGASLCCRFSLQLVQSCEQAQVQGYEPHVSPKPQNVELEPSCDHAANLSGSSAGNLGNTGAPFGLTASV